MSLYNIYNTFCLVHPCDKPDNGGCSQKCEKDGDNAKCGCDEGYELNKDNKTCKESKKNKIL